MNIKYKGDVYYVFFIATFYTDDDYCIRNNYVPVGEQYDYELIKCFTRPEDAFKFSKEFLTGLKDNLHFISNKYIKKDLLSIIDKSIKYSDKKIMFHYSINGNYEGTHISLLEYDNFEDVKRLFVKSIYQYITIDNISGILDSLVSTKFTDEHREEIYKLKELVQYILDKENK